MKIYKISQTVVKDWDTYDSCVVIAESKEKARETVPHRSKPYYVYVNGRLCNPEGEPQDGWMVGWAEHTKDVKVEELGEAKKGMEAGVIIASFNAG